MENNSKDNWRDEHFNTSDNLKSNNEVWNYSDKLRWYLLAIGKDPKAVESINNFPRVIILPNSWSKLFNDMASDTKRDGLEQYSVIATDNIYGRILLPERYAKGESTRVSSSTIAQHHDEAKKLGTDNIIGSIHTHPSKFKYRSFLRKISSIYRGGFSASDLYKTIKYEDEQVAGVIDMNKEIAFVFRTRETKKVQEFSYLPKKYRDQKSFEDYWHRTKHMMVDHDSRYAEMANGYEVDSDHFQDLLWEINVDIAKKHNLAIYRGRIAGSNSYLGRFYPPSSESEYDKGVKMK